MSDEGYRPAADCLNLSKAGWRWSCVAFAHLAGAICRKWRTSPCYRTSDGIHIALQIARSLPPDLSHSVAKGVPSPSRKSRCGSTPCHASPVRFVSPAFPLLRYLSLGRQGRLDYVNFGTYVPPHLSRCPKFTTAPYS